MLNKKIIGRNLLVTGLIVTGLSGSMVSAEEYKEMGDRKEIRENHIFKIMFSEEMNMETINKDTVWLEDENGEKIDIYMDKRNVEGKTKVGVKKEGNGLEEGVVTMYVDDGIKDDEGESLKSSVKREFEVVGVESIDVESDRDAAESMNRREFRDYIGEEKESMLKVTAYDSEFDFLIDRFYDGEGEEFEEFVWDYVEEDIINDMTLGESSVRIVGGKTVKKFLEKNEMWEKYKEVVYGGGDAEVLKHPKEEGVVNIEVFPEEGYVLYVSKDKAWYEKERVDVVEEGDSVRINGIMLSGLGNYKAKHDLNEMESNGVEWEETSHGSILINRFELK